MELTLQPGKHTNAFLRFLLQRSVWSWGIQLLSPWQCYFMCLSGVDLKNYIQLSYCKVWKKCSSAVWKENDRTQRVRMEMSLWDLAEYFNHYCLSLVWHLSLIFIREIEAFFGCLRDVCAVYMYMWFKQSCWAWFIAFHIICRKLRFKPVVILSCVLGNADGEPGI